MGPHESTPSFTFLLVYLILWNVRTERGVDVWSISKLSEKFQVVHEILAVDPHSPAKVKHSNIHVLLDSCGVKWTCPCQGFKVKSEIWCIHAVGAGIAQLVVHGLAVHGVAGSILLWGHFPVEGIFPLELTWVQTPFPQKLLRMRV